MKRAIISLIILLICVGCGQEKKTTEERNDMGALNFKPGALREESNGMTIVGNGEIRVLPQRKYFSISIESYNEIKQARWELLDVYYKNNCRTSLWRNKKTGDEKEVIGITPPSKRLIINEKIINVKSIITGDEG